MTEPTELPGDTISAGDPLTADLLDKVDAGAALVYALYHAPAGWWTKGGKVPDPVHMAYMRASQAYRVGRPGVVRLRADQFEAGLSLPEPTTDQES